MCIKYVTEVLAGNFHYLFLTFSFRRGFELGTSGIKVIGKYLRSHRCEKDLYEQKLEM